MEENLEQREDNTAFNQGRSQNRMEDSYRILGWAVAILVVITLLLIIL